MSLASHSAPGAAAGYAFQFERALFWLARSPAGSVVGIETEDDVAIRHQNGEYTLEQNKHSIQEKSEPFGDRSKDLWNTLATWVSALDSGELDAGSVAFLLVTNKTLPDCIAKQISSAKSRAEIGKCLEALKAASKGPSKTIEALTKKVLLNSSEKSLRAVIENCELLDGSDGASGSELRDATIGELQIPEGFASGADSIADELLGWLRRQVLEQWQKRVPAWISRDCFVTQFHAVLDRKKRLISRERAAHLIPVIDEQLGQEKGRNFVKQVCLVTDENFRAEESIRQFIRCGIEKNRLSADGNITDQDWIDFEDSLKSRWKMIFSRVKRLGQDGNEEDVGFRVLTDTTDEHRERLAGVETEQVYLTAGTYHRMADRLSVGWHPRFKELMNEEGKDD